MAKILAFAGSIRRESLNKKLVKIAAEAARQLGAEVTLVDLRDFPLPIYDGDLEEEQGPPQAATELLTLMKEHHGLLLSCPEYNSSITPVLKNAFDWVSRPREGEKPLAAFQGKIAALMSASPGGFGGMRGLVHVRAILGNIGVLVLPNQVSIAKAHEAFTPAGAIADEKTMNRVASLVKELVQTTDKLA